MDEVKYRSFIYGIYRLHIFMATMQQYDGFVLTLIVPVFQSGRFCFTLAFRVAAFLMSLSKNYECILHCG